MHTRRVAVVRRRRLLPAAAVWMMGVFGVSYVALPLFAEVTGLYRGLLYDLPADLVSFTAATLMLLFGVALVGPRVEVPLDGKPSFDPVIAATSGSLAVWGVLHNTLPMLRHFDDMATPELATFLAFNVIESALIGMMLASFTRSRWKALALGAGFQLLLLGTWLSLAG
jgi:hypothetical protein